MLHSYQKEILLYILTHPRCALFLDMGLGKTLCTLSAAEVLTHGDAPFRALAAAPKAIARNTWRDEAARWYPDLPVVLLSSNEKGRMLSKKEREERFKDTLSGPSGVYVITRDQLACYLDWFEKTDKAFKKMTGKSLPFPFQMLILDESQSFKNARAARTRAAVKIAAKVPRCVLLSGTPQPKGAEDLFSQYYILDRGARLGRSLKEFRARFMHEEKIPGVSASVWRERRGASAEIAEIVKDISVSMKNTVITLPKKTENDILVTLPPAAKKVYDDLQAAAVAEFIRAGQMHRAEAANAAVLQAKLIQAAGGVLYTTDPDTGEPDGNYALIHEEKLNAVENILDNTASPVLIASVLIAEREELMKRFGRRGAEVFDGSPGMLSRWNAGKIPILLIHPASAGHGLNFQKGGHTLIWYSLPWSLEQYDQTCARLYRQGQTSPVVIHRIAAKDTADEKVALVLYKKRLSQKALLDGVEARLISDAERP